MLKRIMAVAAVFGGGLLMTTSRGEVYQYWSFNEGNAGSGAVTAEVGGGIFTASASSATLSMVNGSSLNLYGSFVPGSAVQWNTAGPTWPAGNSFTLQFERNGRTGFVLSYDVDPPTPVNQNVWYYSTDGSTWTPFETFAISAPGWETKTVDFRQVTALDSAPTVYFKAVLTGSYGTGANSICVDNIKVSAIPEPSSVTLGVLGICLVGLGFRGQLQNRSLAANGHKAYKAEDRNQAQSYRTMVTKS